MDVTVLKILFWVIFIIIFYSYIGYALLLVVLKIIKLFLPKLNNKISDEFFEPEVSIVIAAYNESKFIPGKIENLQKLDYPKEKIKFLWITDGSTDNSQKLLLSYPDMTVIHQNERQGKIGAINRGMDFIKTGIVIFCDANNFLSKETVKEIVKHFVNEKVGCVAGEKKIIKHETDNAVGSGEGFYWLYESMLKKLESDVNSTIGAVGELIAIRTSLYSRVEANAILDDFVISMRIAEKGYLIKYAPLAIAEEHSSANIHDEMKRKIRIAAGSFQTLPWISSLLNPLKHGFLSLQYWSHKVLRWTFVPFGMFILLPINVYLALFSMMVLYKNLLILQVLFYLFVYLGYKFSYMKTRLRLFFIPYYLFVMNYSIILGFFRFLKGNQSVNWEKSR